MKHADANGATNDLMAGGEFTEGLSCKRGRRKYDICVGNKDEVQKQNREEGNEKLNILI